MKKDSYPQQGQRRGLGCGTPGGREHCIPGGRGGNRGGRGGQGCPQ